jgi:predicted membrane-bound spermidine synthase
MITIRLLINFHAGFSLATKSQRKDTLMKKHWYLFPVLLVEGGSVIAVELLGAKLVAPFYGNSLYVWTAVLGITVLGLTAGYYLGGIISEKYPSNNALFFIVALSALPVFALPHSSSAFMSLTSAMDLRLGIVVTCLLFLLPPLVCFGMVGPLVVRLLSQKLELLGQVAGTVYFTSTIGGIAAAFFYGFYLIPHVGLKMSSYGTGMALIILPLTYFIKRLSFSRDRAR